MAQMDTMFSQMSLTNAAASSSKTKSRNNNTGDADGFYAPGKEFEFHQEDGSWVPVKVRLISIHNHKYMIHNCHPDCLDDWRHGSS